MTEFENMDKFFTIEQYSRLMSLSIRTVYRMIKEKKIYAFKLRGNWRIHAKDIDRIMAENSNIKEYFDEST